MKALDQEYLDQLQEIATAIRESEELAKYIEDEEEEDYQALRDKFEPQIATLHTSVAKAHPLQLLTFETEILNEDFEGLFLPRLLGFSVLRGQLNEHFKYSYPQSHFRTILLMICKSSNFDYLKKRIGQSIQMAFSLSSDIWITNLINTIANKRIRYFLQGQNLPKYRVIKERKIGYTRFNNQFKNEIFQSAEFPKTFSDLKTKFSELEIFVKHRVLHKLDNTSLIESIKIFLKDEEFKNTLEHLSLLSLYVHFFDRSEEDQKFLQQIFDEARDKNDNFNEKWFEYLLALHNSPLEIEVNADNRVLSLLNGKKEDQLSEYYQLMDIIHSKGYTHDDALEAVKIFHAKHEGLSNINECLRRTIFHYFNQLVSNLTVEEYTGLFELTKILPSYMGIFSNQQFNQDIKERCMAYVKKLLKRYTDKRGRDYQDIKKFVATTFVDLNFLTEKQVVELFKTRRKKKTPTAS
ncbi:MAG: hypothetical protein AB8G15_12580 [Saprospiraceae bacterium]